MWKDPIKNPPEKEGYYFAKTSEGKHWVALWKDGEWWHDEHQDGKTLFGLKWSFIVKYMEIPD